MEIVTWYVKRIYVTGGLALLILGLSAGPASAGGILPIGSPAFGTSCANHHTSAHASGATTHGTGAANGNLAGLPIDSPFNQCGGADEPVTEVAWSCFQELGSTFKCVPEAVRKKTLVSEITLVPHG